MVIVFTIWKIIFYFNKQIINMKLVGFKLYSCRILWRIIARKTCVMEKCGIALIGCFILYSAVLFRTLWFHSKGDHARKFQYFSEFKIVHFAKADKPHCDREKRKISVPTASILVFSVTKEILYTINRVRKWM